MVGPIDDSSTGPWLWQKEEQIARREEAIRAARRAFQDQAADFSAVRSILLTAGISPANASTIASVICD